ncbi:MAG: LysR family transcriptional regulator [Myxococcales bacterium FL481]|nr:MAG: LysR family transcriptional regulator [Myxococcales bacterium FL481]
MSLVQLESIVAVAEEGQLARAAKRLHVTQPPLTRRIRGLEEELGVQLFDRTAKGMQLRPAGRKLVDHARSILAEVERARHAVRAAQADDRSAAGAAAPAPASRRGTTRTSV